MVKNNGYSLVEALVAVGIVGILAGAAGSLWTYFAQEQRVASSKISLEVISSTVLSAISNQDAWDITKSRNAAMSCASTYPVSCSANWSSPVSIYTSEGQTLASTNANSGFRSDGSVCSTFDTGTDGCIYRAEVTWSLKCTSSESCQYPDEQYSVHFSYNGNLKINLTNYDIKNTSRQNFAGNHSPTYSCAQRGLIFVGFNQVVRNGDGQIVSSPDANGCIDTAALRGPTGDAGRDGIPGANGPAGPAGSAGGVIIYVTQTSTPGGGDPPTPPICPPGATCVPVQPPVVQCPPGATCGPPPPCYDPLLCPTGDPGREIASTPAPSCVQQYGADYCYLEARLIANPNLLANAIAQGKNGQTLDPAKWASFEGKSPAEVARLLWLDSSGNTAGGIAGYASTVRQTVDLAGQLGYSEGTGLGYLSGGRENGTNAGSVISGIQNAVDAVGGGAVRDFINNYGQQNLDYTAEVLASVPVTSSNIGETAAAAVQIRGEGGSAAQAADALSTYSPQVIADFFAAGGTVESACASGYISTGCN